MDPLHEPGGTLTDVFFPVDSVASTLTVMDDGARIETATIGNEGMVGIAALFGLERLGARERSQTQVPGNTIRMPAAALREMTSDGGLFRATLFRYAQALLTQISQQAACNGLHSVEERTARWLLMTRDRVGGDEFPLTQEFLSEMLGVRRASVTVAAGVLQRAGLITYRRGRIHILDGARLEGASCECYRIIRSEYERMIH